MMYKFLKKADKDKDRDLYNKRSLTHWYYLVLDGLDACAKSQAKEMLEGKRS